MHKLRKCVKRVKKGEHLIVFFAKQAKTTKKCTKTGKKVKNGQKQANRGENKGKNERIW